MTRASTRIPRRLLRVLVYVLMYRDEHNPLQSTSNGSFGLHDVHLKTLFFLIPMCLRFQLRTQSLHVCYDGMALLVSRPSCLVMSDHGRIQEQARERRFMHLDQKEE